jgi:hypothetical protein
MRKNTFRLLEIFLNLRKSVKCEKSHRFETLDSRMSGKLCFQRKRRQTDPKSSGKSEADSYVDLVEERNTSTKVMRDKINSARTVAHAKTQYN